MAQLMFRFIFALARYAVRFPTSFRAVTFWFWLVESRINWNREKILCIRKIQIAFGEIHYPHCDLSSIVRSRIHMPEIYFRKVEMKSRFEFPVIADVTYDINWFQQASSIHRTILRLQIPASLQKKATRYWRDNDMITRAPVWNVSLWIATRRHRKYGSKRVVKNGIPDIEASRRRMIGEEMCQRWKVGGRFRWHLENYFQNTKMVVRIACVRNILRFAIVGGSFYCIIVIKIILSVTPLYHTEAAGISFLSDKCFFGYRRVIFLMLDTIAAFFLR